MMNRTSFLVVAAAAGALGAAMVVAPFLRSLSDPASVTAAKPSLIAQAAAAEPDASIARGRYLVRIAGCNDCHTPGFITSGGATPEQEWLTGDPLGWQGPWGTTYAPNLRISAAATDESAWVAMARTREFLPPMPTPSLRAMTEDDLRAIYRYTRSLGPVGKPAPAHLPPGQRAAGPVVVFPAPPGK